MTMITRSDALDTLYKLIEADILSEEMSLNIQDIASCIEAEEVGRHEWGVARETLAKIYSATRSDLITREDCEECNRIHKKLTFIPSIDERIVIDCAVRDKIEESTGREATLEDVEDWFRRF